MPKRSSIMKNIYAVKEDVRHSLLRLAENNGKLNSKFVANERAIYAGKNPAWDRSFYPYEVEYLVWTLVGVDAEYDFSVAGATPAMLNSLLDIMRHEPEHAVLIRQIVAMRAANKAAKEATNASVVEPVQEVVVEEPINEEAQASTRTYIGDIWTKEDERELDAECLEMAIADGEVTRADMHDIRFDLLSVAEAALAQKESRA